MLNGFVMLINMFIDQSVFYVIESTFVIYIFTFNRTSAENYINIIDKELFGLYCIKSFHGIPNMILYSLNKERYKINLTACCVIKQTN